MTFAVNEFLKSKQRRDHHITILNSILSLKYTLSFSFSLPTVFCVWEMYEEVSLHVHMHMWSPEVEVRNHSPITLLHD